MKYLDCAARIFLGLGFVVFGLNYFVPFLPINMPEMSDVAKAWIGGLGGAPHYLTIVKIVELLGGAMVLTGRALPLGLILLAPLVVNIVYFNSYLLGAPGVDVLLLVSGLFLGYRNWSCFRGLLTKKTACCS
jgi:putative oxidoreductase